MASQFSRSNLYMHSTLDECLVLSSLEPFASGGGRDCYVHPHNTSLCIKVARKGMSPEERRQRVPWWKRWRKPAYKYDDNVRDYKVLKALESDSDPLIWQYLPRCHGWVKTDRGQGLVTDLIRDADGQISRNLREYLRTKDRDDAVQTAFEEFAHFWESKVIPARSLFTDNMAAQIQADGTIRLVVIDGLGSTVLIPWYGWSKRLGRIWARQKLQHLRDEIRTYSAIRRTPQATAK